MDVSIYIDYFTTKCYNVYGGLKFMEKFFEYNFDIHKIVLACYVPKGKGDAIHTNRSSHGIALHISGDKKYIFEGKDILYTGKNDIVFMPEHSNYVVEAQCPGDCYAINFKIDGNDNFEPFVLNMRDIVTDKFKFAEKVFRLKKDGYEMQCKSYLYSIICSMLGEYKREYIPKSTENIIEPALDFIHKNYSSQNISIEYLAKLCGISTTYLRNIFLKCKNMTPIKYINNLKLARAEELILTELYTIDKVAELSGFDDASYFCRYFKKTTGVTPSEYRRSQS